MSSIIYYLIKKELERELYDRIVLDHKTAGYELASVIVEDGIVTKNEFGPTGIKYNEEDFQHYNLAKVADAKI